MTKTARESSGETLYGCISACTAARLPSLCVGRKCVKKNAESERGCQAESEERVARQRKDFCAGEPYEV